MRWSETVLTGDVLLEDVELLEDGVEEALGVVVDDEDLPSAGGVDGADGVEELCGGVSDGLLGEREGAHCFGRL